MAEGPSWCFLHIIDLHAAAGLQMLSRPFDSLEKARVVFQAIVEPVIFGLEADQHSGRLSMAGDDDLVLLGFSQKAREVVLEFGERNLPPLGLSYRASHRATFYLGTIAQISTLPPE